ncbi:MAG: PHP domain-containing protein [Bacteroidetes bacterium]|nr:PHP domain-containing protein [Bacteroidota bacterium]
MFLLDTHIHTKEVSPCGQTDTLTLISLYKKAGYDCLIITDHLSSYYPIMRSSLSWKQKIDSFFAGYDSAKALGKKVGLTVLPAFELSFDNDPNDYLIYGITKLWLYEHKDIHTTNIEFFSDLISSTDSLIVQAHPFRKGMMPQNPSFIHGIEVYNGNPRHNSENSKAHIYAEKHNLIPTSGSDFHRSEDCARGGMILKTPISHIEEFIQVLKARSSELIQT